MFKNLFFLSVFSIISVGAMDDSKVEQGKEALPQWIKEATVVTVILERGIFNDTTIQVPIYDATSVGEVRTRAITSLNELEYIHSGRKTYQFTDAELVARSSSIYYTKRTLMGQSSIKNMMKKYNTATFELIQRQNKASEQCEK